jgi:hypothetical protein
MHNACNAARSENFNAVPVMGFALMARIMCALSRRCASPAGRCRT